MKLRRPFFPAMTAALVATVVLDADVDGAPTDQQLHIVYLYHADCRDVAATLRQLMERGQSLGPGGVLPALTADPTVLPDEATNSLVIAASPHDFDALSGVIRKLDTRRAQLRVRVSVLRRDGATGAFQADATQSVVVAEHEEATLVVDGVGSPLTVSAVLPTDRDVTLRVSQGDCGADQPGPRGCPGLRVVSVKVADKETVAVRFDADPRGGLLLRDSAGLHALLGGAVPPGADPDLVLLVTPEVLPEAQPTPLPAQAPAPPARAVSR